MASFRSVFTLNFRRPYTRKIAERVSALYFKDFVLRITFSPRSPWSHLSHPCCFLKRVRTREMFSHCFAKPGRLIFFFLLLAIASPRRAIEPLKISEQRRLDQPITSNLFVNIARKHCKFVQGWATSASEQASGVHCLPHERSCWSLRKISSHDASSNWCFTDLGLYFEPRQSADMASVQPFQAECLNFL